MTIKGHFRPVINCHCIQCAKTHGNYAAYTSVLEENITYKSKSTLKWFVSLTKAKKRFCKKSGASVFFKRLGSKAVSASAGLFKNPTKLKTTSHIYIHNKRDYYKISDNLQKFKKDTY
jgi:hypothetical protein